MPIIGKVFSFIEQRYTSFHTSHAMYSAQIRNCPFRFDCSKTWDALQETEDMTIRFCEQCQRPVHYCKTQSELHEAIVKDQCVLVEIMRTSMNRVQVEVGHLEPQTYQVR